MLAFCMSVVLGSMTILGPLLVILGWMSYRSERPAKRQAVLMAVIGVALFSVGICSLIYY